MLARDMAKNIRTLRLRHGYTQERLARALGLTPTAVSKWECGQALPDITVLGPLAAALGTTTDELLGYSPDVDEGQAASLLGAAQDAIRAGNIDGAVAQCERTLHAYPASITIAFIAASLLMEASETATEPAAASVALKRSMELFERCRQEGTVEQREVASFVLAGQYALVGEHERAFEAARSIPRPQADPRIMESAALAAGGRLDEAEHLARKTLAEKEEDIACLRDLLTGIDRKRGDR